MVSLTIRCEDENFQFVTFTSPAAVMTLSFPLARLMTDAICQPSLGCGIQIFSSLVVIGLIILLLVVRCNYSYSCWQTHWVPEWTPQKMWNCVELCESTQQSLDWIGMRVRLNPFPQSTSFQSQSVYLKWVTNDAKEGTLFMETK
jgi:hypothetical protein